MPRVEDPAVAWGHSGLGDAYSQAVDPQRTDRRPTKRPERLGYRVALAPAPAKGSEYRCGSAAPWMAASTAL